MGAKIAELRHRITIQQLTRTSDNQGGWTEAWSNFAEVWASITPVSARERYFSDQIQQVTTHQIVIRNLEGLNSEMRILFDSRIFQIQSIRYEIEEKWFIMIDCLEGTGS